MQAELAFRRPPLSAAPGGRASEVLIIRCDRLAYRRSQSFAMPPAKKKATPGLAAAREKCRTSKDPPAARAAAPDAAEKPQPDQGTKRSARVDPAAHAGGDAAAAGPARDARDARDAARDALDSRLLTTLPDAELLPILRNLQLSGSVLKTGYVHEARKPFDHALGAHLVRLKFGTPEAPRYVGYSVAVYCTSARYAASIV